MHLLAIDLGTSSVKVLLTTEIGQILGQANAEYPLYHPQPNQTSRADRWPRPSSGPTSAAGARLKRSPN